MIHVLSATLHIIYMNGMQKYASINFMSTAQI